MGQDFLRVFRARTYPCSGSSVNLLLSSEYSMCLYKFISPPFIFFCSSSRPYPLLNYVNPVDRRSVVEILVR